VGDDELLEGLDEEEYRQKKYLLEMDARRYKEMTRQNLMVYAF